MNRFKSLLIVLLVLANIVVAQPAFADRHKYTKNPDYIEVNKSLDELLAAKDAQVQTEGSIPKEMQKKIDELKFQKYALETGINWGQCRNQTENTLGVYGSQPDVDDDDDYPYDNALYFLAAGQTTKNKWDCNGVYLPSGMQVSDISPNGKSQELTEPVAVKITDGTQLVVKKNPYTGAVEFGVPLMKVIKDGETKWFIPNVTQATINTRIPNAPTANAAEGARFVAKQILDVTGVEALSASQPLKQVQVEPQP